jgi:hypothetical protein
MSKNLFFFFLFFIAPQITFAQYTEIINSNRPGASESTYAVGTGVFQVENGIAYHKITLDSGKKDSYLNNLLFLRQGFILDELEINFMFHFNEAAVSMDTIDKIHKGFIDSYGVGLKYLLYNHQIVDNSKNIRSWKKRHAFNWSQFIPSVAATVRYIVHPKSTNLGFTSANKGGFSAGLLFQNQLRYNWNLLTNFNFDCIGRDDQRFFTTISSTYTFNNKWSVYLENIQTYERIIQDSDDHKIEHWNRNLGTAYLVHKNLQVDASANWSSLYKNSFGISAGISWRVDRHKGKAEIHKPNTPFKGLQIEDTADTAEASFDLANRKKSFGQHLVAVGFFLKESTRKTGRFFSNVFSKKARKRNETSLKKPVRGVHLLKEHKSHSKLKKKPKAEIQTKDMDQKASP